MLSYKKSNGKTGHWHIGEACPVFEDMELSTYKVTETWADGDELEYITRAFLNIPTNTTKRTLMWFGDIANFIVRNL
jgi:hypothetical protein